MSTGTGSFAYEAQTADGQVLRGTLEAASTDDAQARLRALQLHVLSVVLAAEAKPGGRGKGSLGLDDFVVFNQQLGHLTEAGMPVERGLRLIALDLKSGRLARAAEEVASDLEKGMPLKDAFARNASRFPPLYGKLVEAGANAGNLPGMLFNLGKHMELAARLRQSLWRTVSYPLMVLGALSLVLLLISLYVLPHFEVLYAQFNMQPMMLTQSLITVGHVYPMIWAGLVLVIVIMVVTDYSMKASGHEGIRFGVVMRGLPLIGGVLRASLLARWIDALRLGIESGLDLPRAIDLATEATGGAGEAFAREAKELSSIAQQGLPLSTFTGRLIPPTVPASIELASNAADLPAALYSLTRMYEQQAEHKLRLLPTILTPVLMMVVGVSIGLCIGGMYAPLMQFIRLLSSVSGE